MEPARQDPDGDFERYPGAATKRNPAPRHAWDDTRVGHGPRTRRVEAPPALAMVAAPVVGLMIWGGLVAIVF